jgi:hydrogenase-4 component E
MEQLINILFVAIVFMNLILLGTVKIDHMIRFVAVQGMLLSILPPVLEGATTTPMVMAGVALVIKGIVIPYLLIKAMHDIDIKREDNPRIGTVTSMIIGLGITSVSMVMARTHIPQSISSHPMILPVGISTFSTGVILLVSRLKALTQVIGYLVFDNAIFIFGLLLMNKLPFMVEMGILLDLLVCIFVMGIMIHVIAEHFSTIDTRIMNRLKE